MAHYGPEVYVSYKLGDVVCKTNKWKSLRWHQQIPGMQAKPHCKDERNLCEHNHIYERRKMQPSSSLAVPHLGNCTRLHVRKHGHLNRLICLTHDITFLLLKLSELPLMQRE